MAWLFNRQRATIPTTVTDVITHSKGREEFFISGCAMENDNVLNAFLTVFRIHLATETLAGVSGKGWSKNPENNVPLNFPIPLFPSCICTHHRRSFHPATWPPAGRVGARQHGRLERQLVPIGHTAIHFVLFIHSYSTETSEMSVDCTGQCGSPVSSPVLQKGMIYVQHTNHFVSFTEPWHLRLQVACIRLKYILYFTS